MTTFSFSYSNRKSYNGLCNVFLSGYYCGYQLWLQSMIMQITLRENHNAAWVVVRFHAIRRQAPQVRNTERLQVFIMLQTPEACLYDSSSNASFTANTSAALLVVVVVSLIDSAALQNKRPRKCHALDEQMYLLCVRNKKREQHVFAISSIKRRRFWWNLVDEVHGDQQICCKSKSLLYTTLWSFNSSSHMWYHWVVKRKKLQNMFWIKEKLLINVVVGSVSQCGSRNV